MVTGQPSDRVSDPMYCEHRRTRVQYEDCRAAGTAFDDPKAAKTKRPRR